MRTTTEITAGFLFRGWFRTRKVVSEQFWKWSPFIIRILPGYRSMTTNFSSFIFLIFSLFCSPIFGKSSVLYAGNECPPFGFFHFSQRCGEIFQRFWAHWNRTDICELVFIFLSIGGGFCWNGGRFSNPCPFSIGHLRIVIGNFPKMSRKRAEKVPKTFYLGY